MNIRQRCKRLVSTGLSAWPMAWCVLAVAETAPAPPADHLTQPVYRVENEPAPAETSQDQPDEHPLIPAIRYAKAGMAEIDAHIQDYSCTLIKRERMGRKLGPHEYIFTKVRHRPFSVYMYFLGPKNVQGRECIYVEGKNENKLIAHEGKGFTAKLGVFRLDPNGVIAMRGQRYPITEVGIRNLTARLVEVAEQDTRFGECDVKWFKNTKVNNRTCTCIQVTHPTPRSEFRFHLARVFVDDELQFPIRYESYQWPRQPGGEPILDEEYTYLNMKINNGFTDADFEERNPRYRFQ
jgi:hypothetical protein